MMDAANRATTSSPMPPPPPSSLIKLLILCSCIICVVHAAALDPVKVDVSCQGDRKVFLYRLEARIISHDHFDVELQAKIHSQLHVFHSAHIPFGYDEPICGPEWGLELCATPTAWNETAHNVHICFYYAVYCLEELLQQGAMGCVDLPQ